MLKCGLIGNPLGHSYSPMIHSLLSKEYTYDLFELKEDVVVRDLSVRLFHDSKRLEKIF